MGDANTDLSTIYIHEDGVGAVTGEEAEAGL